jgi:hypothetical protein
MTFAVLTCRVVYIAVLGGSLRGSQIEWAPEVCSPIEYWRRTIILSERLIVAPVLGIPATRAADRDAN